ncbi:prephenate dehydratase domain-containing protein [Pigmentibacter sp. JX0631]|uniref:prephenate dehydratase n=1 Tax=Pigmentibacter sp. JX0631 TaxID=2976982 RepID=UPI002468ADDE|nr:prephenate dehydratase domain-containing protein [Pigmentibacter sp. JX0631]WGL60411.1 prephenate dehydratase domain-containing protein [Pigmentibacter sp. JX0631]
MKLGISGDIASFSEEAAKIYSNLSKNEFKFSYYNDIDEVLFAVSKKEIEYGIFPIYNSKAGIVRNAFAAMGKFNFNFIETITIKIEHNLILKKDIELNEINNIISHPQAFAQCENYLKKTFKNIKYIEEKNTALAGRKLSNGMYPENSAIIGHKNIAAVYNLKIKANKIQDNPDNQTTFIIVENII